MGPFEALGCDFKVNLDAVAESESVSRRGTLRLTDADASYSASFAAVRRIAVNPLEVSGSERREYKIDMVGPEDLKYLVIDGYNSHTSVSFHSTTTMSVVSTHGASSSSWIPDWLLHRVQFLF